MKDNESKWRQMRRTNEGRGRQMETIEGIEGRSSQLNGNEGIWTNMEAYEGK